MGCRYGPLPLASWVDRADKFRLGKEAEARQASGQKAKEESVEEQMARLGLKTFK